MGNINMKRIIVCACFALVVGTEFVPNIPEANNDEGKKKLDELMLFTRLPGVGECWLQAITFLQASCESLTDTTHAKLALRFSDCFTKQNGIGDLSKCDLELGDPKACFAILRDEYNDNEKNLDRVHGVYTEFFSHTRNLCFYLQNSLWQTSTWKTITALSASSNALMSTLNDSVANSKALVLHGETLNKTLLSSFSVATELRDALEEQRKSSFAISKQIASLRSIFLDEFYTISSLAFHIVSLFAGHLVTETERTKSAKFWVFLIMVCDYFCERFVIKTLLAQSENNWMGNFLNWNDEYSENFHFTLWYCRSLHVCLALLTVLYHAVRYRDYNVENHHLLQTLHDDAKRTRALLETSFSSPSLSSGSTSAVNISAHDSGQPPKSSLPIKSLWKPCSPRYFNDTVDAGNKADIEDLNESGNVSDQESEGSFFTIERRKALRNESITPEPSYLENNNVPLDKRHARGVSLPSNRYFLRNRSRQSLNENVLALSARKPVRTFEPIDEVDAVRDEIVHYKKLNLRNEMKAKATLRHRKQFTEDDSD